MTCISKQEKAAGKPDIILAASAHLCKTSPFGRVKRSD